MSTTSYQLRNMSCRCSYCYYYTPANRASAVMDNADVPATLVPGLQVQLTRIRDASEMLGFWLMEKHGITVCCTSCGKTTY